MRRSTKAASGIAGVAAFVVVMSSTPVGAAVLDEVLPKGDYQPLSSGAILSLSSTQSDTAKALVGADPLLKRLVGTQKPSLFTVDTWTHAKDSGLIGAVVRITLPEPISFDGEAIPTLSYDAAERTLPYYTTKLVRWRVQDATQIVVSIDLTARRIVGVHFISDAEQTALDPIPTVAKPGDQ